MQNEEFHNVYSSTNIIRIITSRRMRWTLHVASVGLGRKDGRRLLGSPRIRWEDNIKISRREMGLIWLKIRNSSGLFRIR
jgi:hypothetical protein